MIERDLRDGLGGSERVRVKRSLGGGWSELEDGRVVSDKALWLTEDDPDYCERCGGPHR
jgi:hypothetical protein